MSRKSVYLKQNVRMEPLYNQWYAWAYLIPPAQAAMYTANLHLKIMRSFVSNPQVHMAAVKNPSMAGGPFVNYDQTRVSEVQALIERIVREQTDALETAEAIKTLDELLAAEALGYSLEPLYEKVPKVLRGYVELGYDQNNHPSIRFLEGLLFKSRYYDPSRQSIALLETASDKRPFILSTPLLDEPGRVHLEIPFNHEGIDELFESRFAARSLDDLKARLGIGDKQAGPFGSLFSEQAPPPAEPYMGDGVRLRYFGHACVLIESAGTSILTDPVISYKYDAEPFRHTYCDLPQSIDYVLITHSHSDHFILEALLQLRHKIRALVVPKNLGGVLIDPSLKLMLQQIGFKNVREIDETESLPLDGGAITALPFLGEHADLHIKSKLAYHVSLKGRSMIFAADSNNVDPDLYRNIHALIGDVDVIFLGMECVGAPMSWTYGPLLTKALPRKMDQSRRFDGSDSRKALALVRQLNAGQVYVYAMGEEPWLTHLTSLQYTEDSKQIVESKKLVDACRERNVHSERLFCAKDIILGMR